MTEEELRRLAEAATPGPWYHRQPFLRSKVDALDWYDWVSNMQINAPGFQHIVPRGVEPKNAAYIAVVNPQTVLGLLDEIEALKKLEANHD